jgi:sugar/nucleoside kinase (ribokinase family)
MPRVCIGAIGELLVEYACTEKDGRNLRPAPADADLLFPGEALADWSGRLLAGAARTVVLKRGDQGCVGRDAGGSHALPAHKIAVVHPPGAGDCFCATFVTLMTAGQPLPEALARANAASALAVMRLGPMEGNSSLAEIDAMLEAAA